MNDDGGPSISILVSDRQREVHDIDGLVGLARAVLLAEGRDHVELSLSLVDEREMTQLHERYLHEPGPTDVLSFPLDETDRNEDGSRVLGDVVVAPAVAARNRPDDPAGELRLLIVHGVLHILGYDHEDGSERAEMWARQEGYSGVRVP